MKNLFKFFFLFIIFSYSQKQDFLVNKLLQNVYKNYDSKEYYIINFQYLINNFQKKLHQKYTGIYYCNKQKYHISIFGYNYIFDGNKHYQINNQKRQIFMVQDYDDFVFIPTPKFNFYNKKCKIKAKKYNLNKKIEDIYLIPKDLKCKIAIIKLTINLLKKEFVSIQETYKNGIIITINIINFNHKVKLNKTLFMLDKKKYKKYQITPLN